MENCISARQNSFLFAIEQTKLQARERQGIGTLNEKSIHAILKNFYAPYAIHQEVKVNGYVADIMINDEIIEIQTRHFNTLRKKLDAFLPDYKVTIVHPIAHTKWISWINEQTGEVSKKRKSPKQGSIFHIIRELYRIKPYLSHPHLHLIIPLLEVEEYRLLNGWSHDKKKGASRHDGYPSRLVDEIYLSKPADYVLLLPANLQAPFTSKDYAKLAKITPSQASTALGILYNLGIVERIGKKGNAFLYQKAINL